MSEQPEDPKKEPEFKSETSKHRQHVVEFCKGNGVDIGSGGDPVVPEAIQIELPEDKFEWYNSGRKITGSIYRREGFSLPFKDLTLDYVYSSHLLEDYFDWWPVLREWVRPIKIGGYLIILVPDKKRWADAIARGQPPNCEHRHESHVGELSEYAQRLGLEVLRDSFAEPEGLDYTVVFIARRIIE